MCGALSLLQQRKLSVERQRTSWTKRAAPPLLIWKACAHQIDAPRWCQIKWAYCFSKLLSKLTLKRQDTVAVCRCLLNPKILEPVIISSGSNWEFLTAPQLASCIFAHTASCVWLLTCLMETLCAVHGSLLCLQIWNSSHMRSSIYQ